MPYVAHSPARIVSSRTDRTLIHLGWLEQLLGWVRSHLRRS